MLSFLAFLLGPLPGFVELRTGQITQALNGAVVSLDSSTIFAHESAPLVTTRADKRVFRDSNQAHRAPALFVDDVGNTRGQRLSGDLMAAVVSLDASTRLAAFSFYFRQGELKWRLNRSYFRLFPQILLLPDVRTCQAKMQIVPTFSLLRFPIAYH